LNSKTNTIKAAAWVEKLPPYLFAKLDEASRRAKDAGMDVIDLGTGDPDIPTPAPVVTAMQKACADPSTHKYPSYSGSLEFRTACTDWMNRRFGIKLDPQNQVMALIGAKEGVAHLVQAFVGPQDVVLATTPGYPPYFSSATMVGAESYAMPLLAENDFLPRFDQVPEDVCHRTKIIFINYPNNPTGGVATLEFFKTAIEFAKKHNALLVHDAAYSESYGPGEKPLSIFEAEGAEEIAVEMHSFSKAYNMCGWRIGFLAGNASALNALGTVKKIIDSGPFTAVQKAAIAALEMPEEEKQKLRDLWLARRAAVVEELKAAGIEFNETSVTIYVWAKTPEGFSDDEFCARLVEESGVVVAPGASFGSAGAGYFRIALCQPEDRLREAARRISEFLKKHGG